MDTEPFLKSSQPPTDRQVAYARDLKVHIPEGASAEDVSALISIAVDGDIAAPTDLKRFAQVEGLIFSPFIGKSALLDEIFHSLSQERKIAFFFYSVYRDLAKSTNYNMRTSPYMRQMFAFSKQFLENDQFIKSMNKYYGASLDHFGETGGSKNTIAYKLAAISIKTAINIRPPQSDNNISLKQKVEEKNERLTFKDTVIALTTIALTIAVLWFLSWLIWRFYFDK